MEHRFSCDECGKDEEKKKETGALGKELLDSRSIIISEEISEELALSVYAQILVLDARSQTDPVTVYINSPGGDADSGFGIYDMLKFMAAPVRTVVCGLCASAAVTIFLAADKGCHYALPNARFLLHQPSTGIRGSASDIQITADEINKTRDRYNQIVSDVTGKKISQIASDADRDFWLSPEDAKKYGLVAKIISSRKEL